MLPPKSRPRYLPTLTQVVTSAELAAVESVTPQVDDVLEQPDNEQLIQQIVQSLALMVNARIQDAVQELLENQLHHLEAKLQLEVESMVRRAVNECKAQSGK